MPYLKLVVCLFLSSIMEIGDSGNTSSAPETCQDSNLNCGTNTQLVSRPMGQLAVKNRILSLDGSSLDVDSPLLDVMIFIAQEELADCSLVVAYDQSYENSTLLPHLLSLPHLKQIVAIKTEADFSNISWKSPNPRCVGYFFLFSDVAVLSEFTQGLQNVWDYQGKYVLVGLSKNDLDVIVASKKMRKTEHIIGLVQETDDAYSVYMNQMYWGEGVKRVNRWRQKGLASDATIFPDKTSDLKGAELKMYVFQFEPHVIMPKRDEEGGRPMGRDIQIADTLAENLNFTLVFKETAGGESWGYPDSNISWPSWNGMTGHVQRDEGHFGMDYSFVGDARNLMDYIDNSRFYDIDKSCFMSRIEPPLPRWKSLVAPFQMKTWLALLVCLLVVCPVLYAIAKAQSHKDSEATQFKKMSFSCLYTLGIHLQEPQHRLPQRSPTQIWVIFLWLYGFILTAGYSCNLTAFLTVERPGVSIQTIKELHSTKMDILGTGYFYKLAMEGSKDIYLRDLAKRYVKITPDLDFEGQLRRGKAVFLETQTYQEYIIATNYTRKGIPYMRIMKECYSPQSIGIVLQNNFPLRNSFDRVLGRLYDNGILIKWYSDILRNQKKPEEEAKKDSDNKDKKSDAEGQERESGVVPLNIDHLQGIFYIHIFGLFIATSVFLFDKVSFRATQQQNRFKKNPKT